MSRSDGKVTCLKKEQAREQMRRTVWAAAYGAAFAKIYLVVKDMGYEPTRTATGEEAWGIADAAVEGFDELPNAMLWDEKDMPWIDG
jgi:hypothetical protein